MKIEDNLRIIENMAKKWGYSDILFNDLHLINQEETIIKFRVKATVAEIKHEFINY
jgi:hypothetical protein